MRIYRITITADRYSTDYNVEASNWGTALARAARKWQKRFKGSRASVIRVQAVKSTTLLRAKNGNENEEK